MNAQLKKINALVSLLGDDDVNIRRVARSRLLAFGPPAVKLLNEVAYSDSEGRIRIEAKSLLEEIRISSLAAKFERLQNEENFKLEMAALLLAQLAYPDLDADAYVAKLDQMADRAAAQLAGIDNGLRRVELFNQFFFVQLGFQGNRDAYYDPENSYINRVIDRKVGIPISLSLVYMLIANRLGLPIFGILFPGHFLLKYISGKTLFFIDAFNGGLILTVQDCELFSERMGFKLQHSHLRTATPDRVFARMLRNLHKIYDQLDDQRMLTHLKEVFYDYI